jgi:hypothetical protein
MMELVAGASSSRVRSGCASIAKGEERALPFVAREPGADDVCVHEELATAYRTMPSPVWTWLRCGTQPPSRSLDLPVARQAATTGTYGANTET